ncbi:hypothetical protein GCM10025857_40130 [Alicyclobacillus contaminans]|nr:hypothetical protein GCM10025857_40130 [Alicyclobacillus contaminans]
MPGVYEPTDDDSGRLTYTGGSTTGGAIVYDNGLYLYSHHATDPAGGRLVNAWDLVRLHKFGELDDDAKPDTPVNKLPSYTAMCQFALQDAGVAALLNQERYEQAVSAFTGLTPTEDEPANWISKLKVSPSSGAPAKTIENVMIVLEHDPVFAAVSAKTRLPTQSTDSGRYHGRLVRRKTPLSDGRMTTTRGCALISSESLDSARVT